MVNDLRGKRVLLVEDDYFAATELAAQLSARGLSVVGPAANVDNAFAHLHSEAQIEAGILDINLGGDVVFSVADELERRGLPFIFASGYEPRIVPARHADKILLRKPLDEEAVAAALMRALYVESIAPEDINRNGLLSRLPQDVVDSLTPALHKVYLPRGALMEVQGQTVNRVYFPLECVASLIAIGHDGTRIETGLIGREGMTGFGIVEGDVQTPFELINQIEGLSLAASADVFEKALAAHPMLRCLALRFARTVAIQVSYTALANGRSGIRQRLARWLLMVQDRIDQNPFNLTHDYLAVMLGVRRSSVTDALHLLEGERLIRSNRSRVEIINRKGLKNVAGEIYGPAEHEYERLMSLATH